MIRRTSIVYVGVIGAALLFAGCPGGAGSDEDGTIRMPINDTKPAAEELGGISAAEAVEELSVADRTQSVAGNWLGEPLRLTLVRKKVGSVELRGFLREDGPKTAFISTPARHAKRSRRGIGVGTSCALVYERYGEPEREWATTSGRAAFWRGDGIIFHCDARDSVSKWTLYGRAAGGKQ